MARVNNRTTPDSSEEPDILSDLLVRSTASAVHGQRWLDAARRGYALHLLHEERVRHGYVSFPVWEYLADLARHAKVSLDSVLAAFDLDSRPVVSRRTAGRIAAVLRRIGCPEKQALHMMCISFADVHGFSVQTDLAIVRRAGTADRDAESCAEALGRVEQNYPAPLKAELEQIKSAVAEEFKNVL